MAGILWGIISLFVRALGNAGLDSMQIVAIRVSLSAVIMVIYLLITDTKKLKIRPADIPLFLGTGICSIDFFNFCYFEAIDIIGGAAVPALLLYTAPIFVMIFSLIFFHEKITGKKCTALILTLIGLILVTGALTPGAHISLRGTLFGIGAGFGYSLYSIFGKYLTPKYSAETITTYTFITASCCAVPFSGIIPKIHLISSGTVIFSALALSLVCTVLPFTFYTKGLNGMDAGKASILATAEPFTAAVVGAVFFLEKITPAKLAGMILILAAIILLNSRKPSKA